MLLLSSAVFARKMRQCRWPPIALEELPSEARSTLINVGALERHGAGRAAFVAGDDGPTFRELAWQADQNAYGYFDAADGSVVLAPEAQMLFRVALPWWLAWLAASLALTNSGQPTELVPTSAWDIGDLWITRQRNIPILFVRRLHRDATLNLRASLLGQIELRVAVEIAKQPPASMQKSRLSGRLYSGLVGIWAGDL